MRTRAIAALCAATLMLAGCASADDEPAGPQGPNGYTLSADLGDGYLLWWDRSPESGMTDLIASGPEERIIGSCLGTAPQLCWVGPEDTRISLLIVDPAAERGVVHYFGQDVELVGGDGPAEDQPAVFAARMPAEHADEDASWSIEVFDADGQPVPVR